MISGPSRQNRNSAQNVNTGNKRKLTEMEFPVTDESFVMAPSGMRIDTDGLKWILSPDKKINWSDFQNTDETFHQSVKKYIRFLISNNSPHHVANQFTALAPAARSEVKREICRSIEQDGVIGKRAFNTFLDVVRRTVAEAQIAVYAGAWVRWYVWATDAGFDIFDCEVAAEFTQLRVGSNPLGVAVLNSDPTAGPLRDVEITEFRSALKAASRSSNLRTSDLALSWLFLSFGTNPKNLTLLEEGDLIRTEIIGEDPIFELKIPRIKKRTAGDRDQFRTRRLTPFLGRLLEQLILENNEYGWEPGFVRPIFRRERPNKGLQGSDFWPYAYRLLPGDLGQRLNYVSDSLNLKSFEGEPLRITPRRLRYTFATRLVQEGASIQAVADALDHSSIDYVQVYFNARSDTVKALDRALCMRLAPIAQAFLGKIVRGTSDAVRGDDPKSKIGHLDELDSKFSNVGTCGSFGACDLLAPVACYTCNDFQAWLDAPHIQILEGLERRRAQKLHEGADPKWTQLYDETMLAVAQVVQRCDEIISGSE